MATDTDSQARADDGPAAARRAKPRHVEVQVWRGPYRVTVSATLLPDEVDDWLRDLHRAGFRPAVRFDRTAEGLPICPVHGVAMKPREKHGAEWFAHWLVRDGPPRAVEWCRGFEGGGKGYKRRPGKGGWRLPRHDERP